MAKAKERPAIPAWQSLIAQRAGVDDLLDAKSIDTGLIDPNPYQPRRQIDPAALAELAASIRANGILQPLTVREREGRYQLIAGERRWRAAQEAGLTAVPCLVRDVSDEDLEMLALLENIQREDLDPIDEAHALKRLRDRFSLSLRDLATRVHKRHPYVIGRLQLLDHPEIAAAVAAGHLTPTAAQEIAVMENETQRRDLLDRVARGERVRVKEAQNARRGRKDAPTVVDNLPRVEPPGRPGEAQARKTAPQQVVDNLPLAPLTTHQRHEGNTNTDLISLTINDLQVVALLRAAHGSVSRTEVVAALQRDLERFSEPER